MIFKITRKAIALIFVFTLLVTFVSCSSAEDKISDNSTPHKEHVNTLSAIPSIGIGREDSTVAEMADEKMFVVCIDPGHGFLDGGCGEGYFTDGLYEKDITLAVAKKLNEELENLGFKTIMTHDGQTFPKSAVDDGNMKFNPNERVSYINTLDIDYLISIHVNSYDADTSISGMRIYFKDTAKKTSEISGIVADSLKLAVGNQFPDSKEPTVVDHTNDTSFAIIRETVAPASLVEIGFVTNAADAENMEDDEWQTKLAEALASGINDYYVEYEGGE